MNIQNLSTTNKHNTLKEKLNMTNLNKTLCEPPSVGFKVFNKDGSECSTDISELTPQNIEKQSYRESVKRQSKIMEILKSKDINGKLMRFRKAWRCSIGWHSWYCFYGQYSVCDNCGLIKKYKS